MPANLLSCDYFVFHVFQLQCVLRGLKFPCATHQISTFCFVMCSLILGQLWLWLIVADGERRTLFLFFLIEDSFCSFFGSVGILANLAEY